MGAIFKKKAKNCKLERKWRFFIFITDCLSLLYSALYFQGSHWQNLCLKFREEGGESWYNLIGGVGWGGASHIVGGEVFCEEDWRGRGHCYSFRNLSLNMNLSILFTYFLIHKSCLVFLALLFFNLIPHLPLVSVK